VGQDGRVSVILREHLPWFPTGVTIHDGSIYVLEFNDAGNSARVRKLTVPSDRSTASARMPAIPPLRTAGNISSRVLVLFAVQIGRGWVYSRW
jgi:hypothetical protein